MGNFFVIGFALFYFFQSDQVVVVDNFEKLDENHWKGRDKGHEKIYKFKHDGKSGFLAAKSLNSDNFIIKKVTIDLVKYPYLNWKWRTHVLPMAGDESIKEKCDVAASIAVVLNASKWSPKSIKYSWSTSISKGTFSKSPYACWPARSDIYVVESGKGRVGEWKSEKVNVLEHYKSLYNETNVKSKVIEAIVIMTDSDNTASPSEADYDEIYFSKN